MPAHAHVSLHRAVPFSEETGEGMSAGCQTGHQLLPEQGVCLV